MNSVTTLLIENLEGRQRQVNEAEGGMGRPGREGVREGGFAFRQK